ncbi:MAG: putative adenylate cyclase [Microvirga sp.]|jgi:adenylate cyclase|nr:putative adenylate cyclase [Microvirga sp.]
MAWLLSSGRHIASPAEFFDQFCWVLTASGLALWPASVHMQVLHPQLRGFAYRWWRDRACLEEIVGKHGIEQTAAFRDSPLRPVMATGAVVRHRVGGPALGSGMVLLRELQEQGATDYLAMPLTFLSGRHQAITFTTDREGGFGEDEITRLLQLAPVLTLIFEVHATRFMMATLLNTYIGRKAGTQVLEGRVRRGSGEHIQAVILVADLRGFTALSDRLPSEQVLDVLNRVFDLIVTPIHAEGGEVLKFLGDGLLAIFSVEACGGNSGAAECALKVAAAIMAGLDELNVQRCTERFDRIELGIGLHLGPVFFGNVGAEDRLDFTALGPAVNLAFRLEALTKRIGSPIIVSGEFAGAYTAAMHPLGRYALHHSGERKPVFAPAPSPRRQAEAPQSARLHAGGR